MQRTLMTILMLALAVGLTIALVSNDGADQPAEPADRPETTQPAEAESPDAAAEPSEPAAEPAVPAKPADEPAAEPQPQAAVSPIAGLKVQPVTQTQPEPVIGSTVRDPEANPYTFEAKFTPWGGGIKHVLLSRYSTTVEEHIPYPVQQQAVFTDDGAGNITYKYPMAAYGVIVNGGEPVYLFNQRWQVVQEKTDDKTMATFALTLTDAADQPVLRITRTWKVTPGRYDLNLAQQFENLTDQPLQVRLTQIGPVDLGQIGGYLGDHRKVVACYLQPLRSNVESKYLTTEDTRFLRSTILDQQSAAIWPAPDTQSAQDLAWVAMTNRYFAAAVHAEVDGDKPAVKPLEHQFNVVRRLKWGPAGGDQKMALLMDSIPLRIASGQSRNLHIELYAGPQAPEILDVEPVYSKIKLGEMIEYNLGGFCAFCTFAWLADGLLAFLSFIHWLVADWGVAIIVLVALVRLILHPLTKNSQVNMMKLGKQMQALQPEIQKLKDKYKDNQPKLNQEMMNLYRERGVNPAAMGLGCLPMFLQMPIWFALYAMLFFAIELRHEPAFYGIFQAISGGNWGFLADLSSPDHFFMLPGGGFTIPLLGWIVDAVNILPVLMAFVFYFQQKYNTQATPTMSDQAAMQQKMMKFMVFLFPVFLYKAPSGLTLYILVSTTVGVIESRRVRSHIQEMEDAGHFDMSKPVEKKGPKPGGFLDRMMKAAEQRQRELEQQRKQQGKGKGGGKKRRK